MKRIYRVDYEEKWPGGEWVNADMNVFANGNGLDAIKKAKKRAMSKSYEDDNGKIHKCIGFRFTGVRVIAEAEV